MKKQTNFRDERTVAVENASYRWGYLILAFGILVLVAYRSLARDESNLDLLALVVLSGIATSVYQSVHQVLTQRWLLITIATVLLAALIAAIIVLL